MATMQWLPPSQSSNKDGRDTDSCFGAHQWLLLYWWAPIFVGWLRERRSLVAINRTSVPQLALLAHQYWCSRRGRHNTEWSPSIILALRPASNAPPEVTSQVCMEKGALCHMNLKMVATGNSCQQNPLTSITKHLEHSVPIPLYEWSHCLSEEVAEAFQPCGQTDR